MARQEIHLGTSISGGESDNEWKGSDKLNDNFIELYNSIRNIPLGEHYYHSASLTADTLGDWRIYGDVNGFYFQYCTVANATKGSGTWVNKFTIEV